MLSIRRRVCHVSFYQFSVSCVAHHLLHVFTPNGICKLPFCIAPPAPTKKPPIKGASTCTLKKKHLVIISPPDISPLPPVKNPWLKAHRLYTKNTSGYNKFPRYKPLPLVKSPFVKGPSTCTPKIRLVIVSPPDISPSQPH